MAQQQPDDYNAAKADKAQTKLDSEYQAKCLSKNLKRIEKALKPHRKRVREYTRRERAYKGDIDWNKDTWRHQVHPPYIFQNIETLEAQLVWDSTITKVYPTKPGDEAGAEALEKLLHEQMEKACLDEAWGKFVKSALVYGVGIGKCHWAQRYSVTGYEDGTEEITVSFDQPTFDVVDPRNFFPDPSATCLDDAKFVCFRYYQDRDWIKVMGEPGPNGEPARWFNVEDALMTRADNEAGEDKPGKSVTKKQVDVDLSAEYEIIEVWTRDRLCVIVNQMVLVQDEPTPFDHHELPFVDGYTLEDPYHYDKPSEVDTQIELQNARWDILNQTLDGLSITNNPIIKIAADVEDPDSYQFFPGAQWLVDRMDEIDIITPENRAIGQAASMLSLLEQDMLNVSAAIPFGPGTNDGTQIDPLTAAEVNAQTSVAQSRVARKRSLLGFARKRLGKMWIALDQQFLTEPVAIRMIGPDGAAFHQVDPATIQGQYDYFIESQQESTDRQQRRTEGLNLLQTFSQIAPMLPQMDQVGLNTKAFIEKILSSYDIQNPDNFYQKPMGPTEPQITQQSIPPTGPPPAQ